MSKKKKRIPCEYTLSCFRGITKEYLADVFEIIPYEQVILIYEMARQRIEEMET